MKIHLTDRKGFTQERNVSALVPEILVDSSLTFRFCDGVHGPKACLDFLNKHNQTVGWYKEI